MRLVPEADVPRALAILNGGNALATVVAAPLGSLLGAVVGWRGAFFCVVPVAALALLRQAVSLPPLRVTRHAASTPLLTLLKRREVGFGMAAVSLFFMGQFTLFTYLRPFLEGVTHAGVSTLSLLLLLLGVAGLAGTTIIGVILTDHMYRTLIATPLVMALVALLLIVFGGSVAVTAVLLGIWGLVATAAPVGWWTWLARTLPDDAEAGGGLIVAVVQLAIMFGASVGGIVFDASGYRATFGMSAAMLVLASGSALVAAGSRRGQRRNGKTGL
jgi:predicted MFS family arabinose efflux permease